MGRVSIEKKRSQERRRFRRNLELGAGPLALRLEKLFAKIARRHIRELRQSGALVGMKPEEPVQVAKSFVDSELDEMVKTIKIFGGRRARLAARRAGKLAGSPGWVIKPTLVDDFLQNKGEFVAGFGEKVSANIARQSRALMMELPAGTSPGEMSRQLFRRVTGEGGALSGSRALGIARTEMAQVDNFAKNEAFTAIGVERVEWLTITDGRERDDHRDMDGETTEVGTPFELPDGSKMLYPADESFGAPPEQVINCRCTTVPV